MAKVKPFKAFIYNREKIGDLSSVVCPPYDIISAKEQDRLYNLNPYNFIHVLLRKEAPGEDKYSSAGRVFSEWLKEQILIQDKSPAVYFYSQQYNLRGEKRTRLGFISLLRLGDKDSPVYAHENTRSEAKEDRLKLTRQVKANLSPIFAVFKDKKRIIQRVFQKYLQNTEPFINVVDGEKTVHKLWRIDDPKMLEEISKSMSAEDMFIADGHHRYEVACAYRQEQKNKLGTITGEEDFNYILTYFTNTDPRGLTIFPIHRVLKLEAALDLADFRSKLKEYFEVEEVEDKTRFFFLMEKSGRSEHVLGFYKDKKFWLLRLKNVKILDKEISDRPKEYRSLDVSILNYLVFKKIIGLELSREDYLTYSADAQEVIEKTDSSPLNFAFFLNPSKIEEIMAVALGGNKMPPKSTYFYPKVLSGLVINKHGQG